MGSEMNVSDPHKWVEVALAVDHTVVAFHGEDHVEQYVLTLFNIVSTNLYWVYTVDSVYRDHLWVYCWVLIGSYHIHCNEQN